MGAVHNILSMTAISCSVSLNTPRVFPNLLLPYPIMEEPHALAIPCINDSFSILSPPILSSCDIGPKCELDCHWALPNCMEASSLFNKQFVASNVVSPYVPSTSNREVEANNDGKEAANLGKDSDKN